MIILGNVVQNKILRIAYVSGLSSVLVLKVFEMFLNKFSQ